MKTLLLGLLFGTLIVACSAVDNAVVDADERRTQTAQVNEGQTTLPPETVYYTATSTPTPTTTPWLADNFDLPIDSNVWNSYYCYPQQWTREHGYLKMTLPLVIDEKKFQYCYLWVRIGELKVSKVLAEVQLIDGYAGASYVGILTTCGDFAEKLDLGRGEVVFRPEGETPTPFFRESTAIPSEIRILELTWNTSEGFLEAYVYEKENEEPLSSTKIACAEYPTFVRIGVYSLQGFNVEAIINEVKVWTLEE